MQAIAVEDASTTAAAEGSYQIDPASLRTVQSGTIYTINGVVSGLTGSQALIQVWRGDSSTGLILYDTNNNPIPVSSVSVNLPSGIAPFSVPIDGSTLPANVPPLSATSPWVITANDATGSQPLSDPLQVPLPGAALPTASFSIDPGSIKATQAGNIVTITGTAREPNNAVAVARAWKGDQHWLQGVRARIVEGSADRNEQSDCDGGGRGHIIINIDLSQSPGKDNLPTTTHPYVVTLCDTLGGNEMPMPVLVPPIGFVPVGAANFSIDAGSVRAAQSGNILDGHGHRPRAVQHHGRRTGVKARRTAASTLTQ